jgi:tRNA threonylcarbamoyladenosine biosynthesis protein TsaB
MSIKILHIETATKVCSVAVSVNGRLIAIKESSSDNYIHGESITQFIAELLRFAKIQINELAAVSISSGPGSYTGLRIGTSTAKGLCFALQIPLIEVPTLDSLMQLGTKNSLAFNSLAVLDAKRMEVYSLLHDSKGKVLKELSADVVDENSYREFEPLICFGDATMKLKDLWFNREITFKENILCSAKGQVILAYSKFQKKEFVNTADFTPNYLKDFQIGVK